MEVFVFYTALMLFLAILFWDSELDWGGFPGEDDVPQGKEDKE